MGRRIGIGLIALFGMIALWISHRHANLPKVPSTPETGKIVGTEPYSGKRSELTAWDPFADRPLAEKAGARTTGNVYKNGFADRPAKPVGEKAALLDAALNLMDKREFSGARQLLLKAFYPVLRLSGNDLATNPEMKALHRAMLAMGICLYKEGGTRNLHGAQSCLADYLLFPDDEDFVQAAQIDLIIVSMELMQSEETEEARILAARDTEGVVETFLRQWPNHPYAQSAASILVQVQKYLEPRRSLFP
jgi:hypothetical protein